MKDWEKKKKCTLSSLGMQNACGELTKIKSSGHDIFQVNARVKFRLMFS